MYMRSQMLPKARRAARGGQRFGLRGMEPNFEKGAKPAACGSGRACLVFARERRLADIVQLIALISAESTLVDHMTR